VLLKSGFTIPQIFLFTGLANAVVAFYIFMLVPEYLLRFVAWVLSHLVYRFKVQGDEHIPTEGAAILVCNHVSFVDAVLLMAASPRPIRFIMDHRIFKVPVLGWLFRWPRPFRLRPVPKTHRPTKPRSTPPPRCCVMATCCASFRKAASPATARCKSSRAAS
jgi:1-acyl-sn-glycerol-3-phosphate acyltransferase